MVKRRTNTGKEKNKHAKDRLHAGRGAVGKTAIVGVLEGVKTGGAKVAGIKIGGVKVGGVKIEAAKQTTFDKQISGAIKAIETTGEVKQTGEGNWWGNAKRKLVKIRAQASQAIDEQSTRWREYVKSRMPEKRAVDSPPPDKSSWTDSIRKRTPNLGTLFI